MSEMTGSTPVSEIRARIRKDFGVEISSDDSIEIKRALKKGTATWTSERYLNRAADATIERIDKRGVKTWAAWYTPEQWKERRR